MSGAAIFDLDRTLLQGGTGPLLSRAMYDLGVLTRRLPGERLLYGLFDRVGETLPSILLARQATLVAKGREMGSFDAAAVAAAEAISAVIHPFAISLIEQHKAAGRPVVLATTTPYHLIAPLAERLGFDHVVATRYRISDDGRFDGSLSGRFVWSRGKLAAVRSGPQSEGVDLGESFAYSDSIFDLPLLSAVGRPAAVNPDPRLTALRHRAGLADRPLRRLTRGAQGAGSRRRAPAAAAPRQPTGAHARTPGSTSPARRTSRARAPRSSSGNHRSYFDLQTIIQLLRRTGRTTRALGKKEIFDVPGVGALATALGGIPVDRTGGGTESFENAAVALEGGELVCLLPQGTIPRGARFYDPVLKGRTGAARLAAMTGAPVIPFGIWGSEHVWPRSSPIPRVLDVFDPPTVRVRVGTPVELKHRSAVADTRRIMGAIVDCLPPEAREHREPTEEEIRRATP